MNRRLGWRLRNLILFSLFALSGLAAFARPVVFWASDSIEPGNVVLFYGGDLSNYQNVRVWRLPDANIGTPADSNEKRVSVPVGSLRQPVIQASDNSFKFVIPDQLATGLYAAQLDTNDGLPMPVIINRPQVWFLQPKILMPGLEQNQGYPNAKVQVIGKDFLLPPGEKGTTHVAFRQKIGGTWKEIQIIASEKFSVEAQLPANLLPGAYEISVHNGFGGSAGWSIPLEVTIKNPDVWPTTIFNVKDLGALGDDVHDDTTAIRIALAKAEANGGGIVYFPWGTYRLDDWIYIPEHTTLRGESRDATVLKWPVDEPKIAADFTPGAVYASSSYAVEDLTFITRKVDTTFVDLSYGRGIPKEIQPKIKPWGQTRDIFIRRVNFQHWLLSSHPDRNKDLWGTKYTGEGSYNIRIGNAKNIEVSDSIFQGGDNAFMNVKNARETNNFFGNEMGYCWTVFGGGARYVVMSGNEIRASSSWGYGQSGMKYVYSAHNKSYNFVRGEREAMTLDISALPTARPVSQYWGSPIEVSNTQGNVTLRFSASDKTNSDGFKTGFTPGCFRGGIAFVRAYGGGVGAGESRKIIDNTEDTITLEKPWDKAPETIERQHYIEIVPRLGGTAAWFGVPSRVGVEELEFENAKFIPNEFADMAVMIMDGRGAGQYREIRANTATKLTLNKPWDVQPDATSTVGIWSVMRHMIVYKSEGYDTSSFAQLYGSFYDYNVDSCKVERNQGIWGQSGWFVQFRYNEVSFANTYHPGIGPHGSNPEKNLPFSFVGLTDGNLRIGKFGASQYGTPGGTAIFVNDVLPKPIPGAFGAVVKGNLLRYNQRIAFPPSSDAKLVDKGIVRFVDVLIDKNRIEHSTVGIQVGPAVRNVLLNGNRFDDVKEHLLIANPDRVTSVDKQDK